MSAIHPKRPPGAFPSCMDMGRRLGRNFAGRRAASAPAQERPARCRGEGGPLTMRHLAAAATRAYGTPRRPADALAIGRRR
jgi:hypothetical protein